MRIRISLNGYTPRSTKEKSGAQKGYAWNDKNFFFSHVFTGGAYGMRHLDIARLGRYSTGGDKISGLERLYHGVIGVCECVPILGSFLALAEGTVATVAKKVNTVWNKSVQGSVVSTNKKEPGQSSYSQFQTAVRECLGEGVMSAQDPVGEVVYSNKFDDARIPVPIALEVFAHLNTLSKDPVMRREVWAATSEEIAELIKKAFNFDGVEKIEESLGEIEKEALMKGVKELLSKTTTEYKQKYNFEYKASFIAKADKCLGKNKLPANDLILALLVRKGISDQDRENIYKNAMHALEGMRKVESKKKSEVWKKLADHLNQYYGLESSKREMPTQESINKVILNLAKSIQK